MNNMSITTFALAIWLVASGPVLAGDDKDSHEGGLPALARRVAALQSVVARQSDQINVLRKALDREVQARMEAVKRTATAATNYVNQRAEAESAARQAADAALQAQIDNLQWSVFSPAQIATLQALADVTSVAQSNIYIAGNICVGGDVAVRQGHTLFASRVQPSDGDCGGNAEGITVFGGNVGILATNTLFVNNLRAFQAIPASPAELEKMAVSMAPFTINGGTGSDSTSIIMYGPLLFRSER